MTGKGPAAGGPMLFGTTAHPCPMPAQPGPVRATWEIKAGKMTRETGFHRQAWTKGCWIEREVGRAPRVSLSEGQGLEPRGNR